MKYFLSLFFIFALVYVSAFNSIPNKQPMKVRVVRFDCSPYYRFNDSIIDLGKLKSVAFDSTIHNLIYQECSEYHERFSYEEFGFNLRKDSVLEDEYCTWVFTNPSTVKVTESDEYLAYFELPHKIFENSKEVRPYTIATLTGIIFIYEIPDSLYYYLYKMDNLGEITSKQKIKHTNVVWKDGKKHLERFLYPYDMRSDFLVFSGHGYSLENGKTIVLDLNYLDIKSFDFNISTVVWDERETGWRGFILQPESSFDQNSKMKMYWDGDTAIVNLDIPYQGQKCETILWQTQLVIVNYHPSSTGSSLHCIDTYSKENIWTADVLQMNAKHSQYSNKVMLSKYRDKILLDGNESNGKYLQIFDMKSGKRLAEFGNISSK